jgi:hypothetical protein
LNSQEKSEKGSVVLTLETSRQLEVGPGAHGPKERRETHTHQPNGQVGYSLFDFVLALLFGGLEYTVPHRLPNSILNMSVSVDDIAAELDPDTRAAIIDNMALFNVIIKASTLSRALGLSDLASSGNRDASRHWT